MASRRTIRTLGYLMVAVFVAMALTLKIAVEPVTMFLPQNLQAPYTDQHLLNFVNTLALENLSGFYRVMLWVDVLFIALFAVWGALLHLSFGTARLRWIGLGLVLIAAALDLVEDWTLFGWLDRAETGFQIALPVNTSDLYSITLVKFSAFVLAFLSAYICTRQFGKRHA